MPNKEAARRGLMVQTSDRSLLARPSTTSLVGTEPSPLYGPIGSKPSPPGPSHLWVRDGGGGIVASMVTGMHTHDEGRWEEEELLRPYQGKIDKLPGVTPTAGKNLSRDLGIPDRIGMFCVSLALSRESPTDRLERHVGKGQLGLALAGLAERLEHVPPQLFTAEIRGDNLRSVVVTDPQGRGSALITPHEMERALYTNEVKAPDARKMQQGMHLGLLKDKIMAAGITLGNFDGEADRVAQFVAKDDGTLLSSFACMFKRTRDKLALDCMRGTAATEEFKDTFDRINPRLYPDEKERKALLKAIHEGALANRDARAGEEEKQAADAGVPEEGGEAPKSSKSSVCRLVTLLDVQNAVKALR